MLAMRGAVEGSVAQHDDAGIEEAVDNSTKRTAILPEAPWPQQYAASTW